MRPDIRPFHISIPQTELDELHARLDATRWPHPVPEAGWSQGAPQEYLRSLVQRWRQFDWRAQEQLLNELPHFVADFDGQPLHFLHVRSPEPGAFPLVITHGWPSSFVEFVDVLGPLTDPRAHGGDPADAFHVIVPSVPGFGFSTPVPGRASSAQRTGALLTELVAALGYSRYGAQGCDVGAGVSLELSRQAPDKVVAIHTSGPVMFGLPPIDDATRASLSPVEQRRLAGHEAFVREGMAYLQMMITRPQTLSYMLTDSPVSQLAFLVEKFQAWTDPAKELPEDAIGLQALLTTASLYWFTRCGASSAHFVSEGMREAHRWAMPVAAPVGTAVFAGDHSIRRFIDPEGRSPHWSEFDRGGHFPALEAPDLLVQDIRTFFQKYR
jgi:pimeloyl-ACP methyl ester carboxylesterase